MKITKRQLRRIIREEFSRLASEKPILYLKVKEDNFMIEIDETGDGYYPSHYPGFAEFLADINDDLGYDPELHQVNVIDYDDLGFQGNLMDAYYFAIESLEEYEYYDDLAHTPEELAKQGM